MSRRTLDIPRRTAAHPTPGGQVEESSPDTFRVEQLIGERIDKWELREVLGQGGMSAVYLAEHIWLGQSAAIKIILPGLYKEEIVLQRFQQEAQTVSRLRHPNIIEVKDFGVDSEHGYFMVLEVLKGEDLSEHIRGKPFPKSWVASVFRQLCAALEVTHNQGIVHRDLKPSNIFLVPGEPHPLVKLLDFGVAKVTLEAGQNLTSTGTIVGTPTYLAPEQVRAQEQVSPATDIYSLGVLLFQMLTGELPFVAKSAFRLIMKIVQEEAPFLGTVRADLAGTKLELIVDRLLIKEPEERPQSTTEVWELLEQAFDEWDDPLDFPSEYPVVKIAGKEPNKRKERHSIVRYSISDNDIEPLAGSGLTPTPSGDMVSSQNSGALLETADSSEHLLTPEQQRVLGVKEKSYGTAAYQETSKYPVVDSSQDEGYSTEQESGQYDRGYPRRSSRPLGQQAISSDDSFEGARTKVEIPSGSFVLPKQSQFDEGALPSQKKDTAIKGKSFSPAVIVVLSLLLIGGVGGVLWISLKPEPKTTKPSQRTHRPLPRVALTPLDKLVKEAESAFRKRAFLRAAALYKRAIKEHRWEKTRHFPLLYREAAVSFLKQKHLSSAVHYFELHQEALKQLRKKLQRLRDERTEHKDNPKKSQQIRTAMLKILGRFPPKRQEKEETEGLVLLKKLKAKRHAKALSMLSNLQNYVQVKNWLLGHLLYQKLYALVPSMPDLHVSLGRLLGEHFPALSLQIEARALELMILTPVEKQLLQNHIKELEQQIAQKKKSFRKLLEKAESKAKKSRWKGAIRFLEKHIVSTEHLSHAFLQKELRKWLLKQVLAEPSRIDEWWSFYKDKQKQLQSKPLWLWLLLQDKDVPNTFALDKELRSLKKLVSIHSELEEAKALLRKGKFSVAKGKLSSTLAMWQAYKESAPKALVEQIDTEFDDAKRWPTEIPKMESALKTVGKDKRKQSQLLKSLDGNPGQIYFRRLFRRGQSKPRAKVKVKSIWYFNRAKALYRKKRWSQAQRLFKKYLGLSSKNAKESASIKKYLKACRCALSKPFPWEVCSSADFPKHFRRK